jgi:hypothetical protein
MSEQDTVTVQVMPRAVAVHDGLAGAFTLLDFAATQPISHVGYPDGSVYVPDYHAVVPRNAVDRLPRRHPPR